MKVIFSPTMFRDIHEDLKKGKEHRTVSGHKFQENLLLGLQQNGMDVFVVNVPRVKHYSVYPDARNNLHAGAVRRLGQFLDKMAHEEDCFVFLSSEMAEAIDVLDKPYVVMEGFYQHKKGLPGERLKDSEKNLVFYAGYLGADYGIEHMLRAFSQINDNSYRLVMAGYGQNDEMIRRYLDRDDRIRFLGMITPEEVEMWQQKATVLISPRTSEQKFAKYSFPSKTMECLASGKPYIAHKLPCDPPEYAEYIQYARDESDEALREKIMEICEMTEEQRLEVGERAKTFIINEKNPKVMCKRIIKMWEKMCDE